MFVNTHTNGDEAKDRHPKLQPWTYAATCMKTCHRGFGIRASGPADACVGFVMRREFLPGWQSTQLRRHVLRKEKMYAASKVSCRWHGPHNGREARRRTWTTKRLVRPRRNHAAVQACLILGTKANKKVILHDARHRASTAASVVAVAVCILCVAWPCGSFHNPLFPSPWPRLTSGPPLAASNPWKFGARARQIYCKCGRVSHRPSVLWAPALAPPE